MTRLLLLALLAAIIVVARRRRDIEVTLGPWSAYNRTDWRSDAYATAWGHEWQS